MPYISADGKVVESRGWFRFSIITDIFWTVVNILGVLVTTLIDPTKPIARKKDTTSASVYLKKAQQDAKKPGGEKPGANVKGLPKPDDCKS